MRSGAWRYPRLLRFTQNTGENAGIQPDSGGRLEHPSLGESLGIIRGIVEPLFGFEAVFYVAPARWKKAYRLGKDKNASLDLARSRFPQAPLTLKKHHNRAESLLLASWLHDFGTT